MTTVTMTQPEKANGKLSAIVKELGSTILSELSDKKKVLDEIRQGLKEVKEIREGRAKSYLMDDLLNE
jgi:hypothetical protein